MIAKQGSRKLETEVEGLHDDVTILRKAIEEAIIKGQKPLVRPSDIPESSAVSNDDFALTCTNEGPGVVGWVDDF